MFFLDVLALAEGTDWLPQNINQWNYYFMLHAITEESRSQNMFNYSMSFYQKNAKWSNINVFCVIISGNTVK